MTASLSSVPHRVCADDQYGVLVIGERIQRAEYSDDAQHFGAWIGVTMPRMRRLTS